VNVEMTFALTACLLATSCLAEETSPATAFPGCVGNDIHACVAYLEKEMGSTHKFDVDAALTQNEHTDVVGKRIAARIIFLPAPYQDTDVHISYNGRKQVTDITIPLLKNPANARTEAEYEATGLYRAVVAAVGTSCPAVATPTSVYRFFEKSVKPRMKWEGSHLNYRGSFASVDTGGYTGFISFCGQRMSFSVLGSAVDTSMVNASNPSGAWHVSQLEFMSQKRTK
jgi:hypothetical protein